VHRLEDELCTYFGRKHCCLTGRGATAIYLALRALPAKIGRVVLPAVVCPSPANAALYAGFDPIFCDVSLEDYNMDVTSLERVFSQHDDAVAVMPVHLYGQPADMDKIVGVARRKGLYVIEDAAQAMGGEYKGRKLGSLGDISIISFGHTKILDIGWGGAVLTDDEELARRIREELRNVPECPANINDVFAEYRKVYYTIKPLSELNDRLNDLFLPLPFIYREMYLFRLAESQAGLILSRLDELEGIVQKRRDNAREYERRLQHPDIIHPKHSENGAPWRYTFLLRQDNQKHITDRMRAEGFDISNWYPPLHRWYASGKAQDPSLFQNAEFLGKHVVNLWVEPSVTPEQIEETCETLLRVLTEEGEGYGQARDPGMHPKGW